MGRVTEIICDVDGHVWKPKIMMSELYLTLIQSLTML